MHKIKECRLSMVAHALIPATWEADIGGSWFKISSEHPPHKIKAREILSQKLNQAWCNPSYTGGIGRRTTVSGWNEKKTHEIQSDKQL
jgi:hypothetical protein